MPVIWIPSMLRTLTDDRDRVRVEGETLRQVVDNLEAAHPGIRDRLCDGGRLKPGLAVSVDSEVTLDGLQQVVGPDSEIHIVPAISGGSWE